MFQCQCVWSEIQYLKRNFIFKHINRCAMKQIIRAISSHMKRIFRTIWNEFCTRHGTKFYIYGTIFTLKQIYQFEFNGSLKWYFMFGEVFLAIKSIFSENKSVIFLKKYDLKRILSSIDIRDLKRKFWIEVNFLWDKKISFRVIWGNISNLKWNFTFEAKSSISCEFLVRYEANLLCDFK